MKCEGWITSCKKEGCGHHYQRTDGITICPECGTERERCKREAVDGYRFCGFHGGPNPKNDFYGLATQAVTSGKKSSIPLTKVASKYIEMQHNGRLLSNRASLEVIRERIRQLAERIDLNQAPDRLSTIFKLWGQVKENWGQPDVKLDMIALDAEFERAYHDYAAWKQMFEAVDLDRKLVESEVKIIKDIRAVLTAEDAYEMTAQLLAAIIQTTNSMENVPAEVKLQFLKRIQYEFTRIVGDRSDKGFGGSGEQDPDAESSELD